MGVFYEWNEKYVETAQNKLEKLEKYRKVV